MNPRELTFADLIRSALELPDDKLRRLSRLAAYLEKSEETETDDPALDVLLVTFRQFAESKGSVIYAILFRKAGIGIQWWEEERAGEKPSPEWKPAEPGDVLTMTYQDHLRLWHNRGLVIYQYYPTLSEAIAREWERLEGK